MSFTVIHSLLNTEKETTDIMSLLNHYATDIMGGGEELSSYVQAHLISKLQQRTDVVVVMVYHEQEAVGLSLSFEGFSTFYAKPLLNIHDFIVRSDYRGQGIAKLILDKIEAIAKERDYCKLTLEVLQGNTRAQKVYFDFGFDNYQLEDSMGHALFLQKKLG
jgi:ribosomal protein S18 acetylase RimI-like enzyme